MLLLLLDYFLIIFIINLVIYIRIPIIVDNSVYHISYDNPDSDYDSNNQSGSDFSYFNFQYLTVFYTNADQFLNKHDKYRCLLLAIHLILY